MKRKIAGLLTFALSATLLLGGCGGSMGGTTTPKSIVDSKDRVIAYVSQNYEKDSKAKKVVVFENGTATLYNTGDYTIGDFAKMTDDEVVESLLTLMEEKNNAEIEKYQGYLAEKQSEIEKMKANAISFQNNKACREWLNVMYEGTDIESLFREYDMEQLETNYEMLHVWMENFWFYLEEHLTDVNRGVCEALYQLARRNEDELFGQGASLAEDWQSYMARHEGEKFAPIFKRYINTSVYDLDDIQAATQMFDTVVAEGITAANEAVSAYNQEIMDSMQQEIDNYNQALSELQNKGIAGDSYPAVINLITDGTGNNVQAEAIVMLDEDSIEYAIGLRDIVYSGDSRKAIYESQYAVYGVTTDGSDVAGFMLIRDNSKKGVKFGIDTLETKDAFIDAEEYSDFVK